jgi:hypothetical protein
MALPVYRKVGARSIQIGDVSTANLKAAAQTYETINNRLDQLKDFTYKKGAEIRKEEATMDALNRPVNAEDVRDAMSKQGEAKSFVSSLMGGSIYDKTFQETQGIMLANEMSLNVLEEVNKMKTKAAAGQIDYATAKAQLVDMVDGYTAAISAFSPEAAKSSKTSMLTAGQTVLNAIGKQEAAAYKASQDAKLEDSMFEVKRIMEDMYSRGDYADETFGFVDAEQSTQLMLQNLVDRATITGNQRMIPKYYEMYREARINGIAKGVMSPEFAGSKIAAFRRIKNNDLGVYQNSWDQMSDDERLKVESKFFKQISDEKKLQEDASKVEKDRLMMEGYELQLEAVTASPERREQIVKRLWGINSEMGSKFTSDTMLEKIRKGDFDSDEGSDELIYTLTAGLVDKSVSKTDIDKAVANKEISPSQGVSLLKFANSLTNKSVTRAIQFGDDTVAADPTMQNAKTAGPIKAKMANAARRASEAGEDPQEAVMQTYESEKASRFTTVFTNSQDKVTDYLSRLGIFDESEIEEKAAAILNGTITIDSIRKVSDQEDIIRLIEKQFKKIERMRP